MRRSIVTFALLLCCGCQARPDPHDRTEEARPASVTGASRAAPLADRVWARSDSTALPGVMMIFLTDGTLVMDSCWETYRLERWRWESDSTVVWHEDTAEIRAKLLAADADHLVLRLDLPGGAQVQQFRAAQVPYLCPDMKR